MNVDHVKEVLSQVRGATFASLDAVTSPASGIIKETTGVRVILFSMKAGSGYEQMVKRRLHEAGKNPDDFIVDELPWGERIDDLPLIVHKGKFYLQTIILHPGESVYRLAFSGRVIDPKLYGLERKSSSKQGLPKDREVVVATYSLDSILRIRILGETITSAE